MIKQSWEKKLKTGDVQAGSRIVTIPQEYNGMTPIAALVRAATAVRQSSSPHPSEVPLETELPGGLVYKELVTRDMLVVHDQQVRAAVAALCDALGDDGRNYLEKVEGWAAKLDPTAARLGGFGNALVVAEKRLVASAPHLRPARDAFVEAVARAREFFTPRPAPVVVW